MKLRKILCLVLAAVMMLSVLAACNNDKPVETKPNENKPAETQPNKPAETQPAETKPQYTFPLAEPLTITVDALLAKAEYPLSENIAWKYIQELSGFVFETTEIVSGEFKEKENLRMNSGEYGEMLFKCNPIDINQYGMDGLILPIEDIIRDYMPNLSAILDERNAWDTLTAPDGHIYGIPNVQASGAKYSDGMTMYINVPWLNTLGLDVPTDWESLYNVLKAFKEQDPNGNGKADEIPLPLYGPDQMYFLTTVFDNGISYGGQWMDVDGEMKYLPTTDIGKETLYWLAKFYKEGLLAQDVFTSDREKYEATAGASEDIIYGFGWDSSLSKIVLDPEVRMQWRTVKPTNPEHHGLANGVRPNALALTDKCKNPEVILAFFDYLYSQEGGMIIRGGVENVSWKLNDQGLYESISEGFKSQVYQATFMGAANVPGIIPDLYYFKNSNAATTWNNIEWYGEGYGIGAVGVYTYSLIRTPEEDEEFSVISTDITTQVEAYYAEVITGMKDLDATWDEFQATLKSMDVERMVEIQNAAYLRAVERNAK